MATLSVPTSSLAGQPADKEHPTEHPHITRLQGIATLQGTRIPVRLIAQMHREGDTVNEILRAYPHLSATAVHDAISYYLDHRAEIEEEIAAHRIENLLSESGAQINERGFITFSTLPDNG
jgi:uncharacterized protein (DUF433 family)